MEDDVVDQVRAAAGLSTHDAARRALEATLDTLADRLVVSRRRPPEHRLPDALREAMQKSRARPVRTSPLTLVDFFTIVSAREGLPRSVSVAHARAVLSVLCGQLSASDRRALVASLPTDFAPLFHAAVPAPAE